MRIVLSIVCLLSGLLVAAKLSASLPQGVQFERMTNSEAAAWAALLPSLARCTDCIENRDFTSIAISEDFIALRDDDNCEQHDRAAFCYTYIFSTEDPVDSFYSGRTRASFVDIDYYDPAVRDIIDDFVSIEGRILGLTTSEGLLLLSVTENHVEFTVIED